MHIIVWEVTAAAKKSVVCVSQRTFVADNHRKIFNLDSGLLVDPTTAVPVESESKKVCSHQWTGLVQSSYQHTYNMTSTRSFLFERKRFEIEKSL